MRWEWSHNSLNSISNTKLSLMLEMKNSIEHQFNILYNNCRNDFDCLNGIFFQYYNLLADYKNTLYRIWFEEFTLIMKFQFYFCNHFLII